MIEITNNKIESIGSSVKWARFPGFSFLFDNPTDNFDRLAANDSSLIYQLSSDLDDPNLILYNKLYYGIRELIEKPRQNNPFICLLPPYSYHVTALDTINKDNVNFLRRAYYSEFMDLFKRLPDSICEESSIYRVSQQFSALSNKSWELKFSFKQLANFSDRALVALLEIEHDSKSHFDVFLKIRSRTKNFIKEFYGKTIDVQHNYLPHITLAYFANSQSAAYFTEQNLKILSLELRNNLKDSWDDPTFISFSSASLYGFTDMVRFFKRK